MSYVKYFIIFALMIIVGTNEAHAEILKDFSVFSKNKIAWFNSKKVRSKRSGFKSATKMNPAEMWFKPTPGLREHYSFSLKSFLVKGYDSLLFKYRVMPNTYLVMDVWWDKGPQKRPLHYIKGDGKWNILKLPITGKNIVINLTISDKVTDKSTSIRKAYFMYLKGVKEGNDLKCKIYKINKPILIPKPKECKLSGQKLLLVKNKKAEFAVCLNSNELALKKIIIDEIAEAIEISSNAISTATNLSSLRKNKTVINLQFGKECNILVPDKKEAYAIMFSKRNNQNIITIAAKDRAGLYWTCQTLKQLIIQNDNSTKINVCDINDWPDYQLRSLGAYNIQQEKYSFAYKYNAPVLPWWTVRGKLWKLPEKYIRNLTQMCNYAVARGVNVIQWLCPFFEKESITVSDDKQIDKLFKLFEISLKTGNKICYAGIDDGGRHKGSFTLADQKAYKNDRLLSHAYFIKKLSDKIYAKYPDAKIITCTKNYETAKGVSGYYDRIGISKNVIIDWTGEQSVTLDYSKDAIERYKKGIEGRNFRIYDNTPGQVHGMYRGLIICEKYATGYKYLYRSQKCIGVEVNLTPDNQIRMILAGSVAEYLWNASRYDAERARQRAIAKVAGSVKAIKPILLFSQEYLKIAYKYPIDKRIRPKKDFILGKGFRTVVGRKKLEKKEIVKYSIDDEEYKKLSEKISLMNGALKQIEQKCKNKMLIAEFKLFYRNMKEIITYLRENSIPAPTINAKGTFVFNMNNIPGGINYKKRGSAKLMSACLYGKQTANNTFTVIFNLKSLPAGKNILLELKGWDCDKSLPLMVIKLNKHKVFSGKTTFGHTYPYKTGPGKMNISIPGKYFCKGKNVIKIIDNAPASDLIDNWIVLAGIKLKF